MTDNLKASTASTDQELWEELHKARNELVKLRQQFFIECSSNITEIRSYYFGTT